MEIKWNDYRVDVDGHQYVLYHKVTRKKKKTEERYQTEEVLGFFSKFESCLQQILQTEVGKDKSKIELTEFINLWKDIIQQLRKVFDQYQPISG